MMRRARRPWYPDQLFWWVRLSAWSLAALPLAITAFALNLISPWLIGAGPVLFEVGFAVLELAHSGWHAGQNQVVRPPATVLASGVWQRGQTAPGSPRTCSSHERLVAM